MIVCFNDSIMNYVSSIRSFYGLESQYDENVKLTKLLNEKKPKKIYLALIDGMGANLLERKLSADSFLRRNLSYKTTTTFPPTTTAATTAILTGLSPNVTGWLGWIQYFKEVDNEVIPFQGIGFFDRKPYGPRFGYDALPVKEIYNELNEKGIKASSIYPAFRDKDCVTFEDKVNKLIDLDRNGDYEFVYLYEDEYDRIMHKNGPSSKVADDYLAYVNEQLDRLADNIGDDAMLIVIADHGQIDVEDTFNICHSKYDKYLRQRPGIEPRTMTFYVKEECLEDFRREFVEEFEDRFILLTHDQVLKTHLFGDGKNHERFEEFIGDYLAIAKSSTVLAYEQELTVTSKGQHAGMCADELIVPIITYMKQDC